MNIKICDEKIVLDFYFQTKVYGFQYGLNEQDVNKKVRDSEIKFHSKN